ncbi:MAG: ABC transporter permease [Cyclobacteriaceae bacterium]
MRYYPPKWIDKFLRWYCNPELIEEIQGDALELYYARLESEGKRIADFKYLIDIIRFCRWSNIKRTNDIYKPNPFEILWNLDLKIAARSIANNKLIFAVKTLGLSVCLGFALLLTAYVVSEITYDQHNVNHERIFRVGSKISFQDDFTKYAVSPLPLGQALVESIPEIESYSRFMYDNRPIYRIDDKIFYDEVSMLVDSSFLEIFSLEFIQGNPKSFSEPNQIILTETLALKMFGGKNAVGETIEYGDEKLLEIVAVIKNPPSNSHLKFQALLSWSTFERNEAWDNLNAYTYIMLKAGVNIETVRGKIINATADFSELIAKEYKASYEPIIENLSDIHFSEKLDEDIAEKRSKLNVFVIIAIALLFFLTGFINYLNLALAELTTSLKKISILKVFGGQNADHRKTMLTDLLLVTVIVFPLTVLLIVVGLILAQSYLSIDIERGVFFSSIFLTTSLSFLALFILSSRVNAYVLSKSNNIVNSIRGKLSVDRSGFPLRKLLVSTQLAFSIIMISLIMVIVDQMNFIEEADKGFDDKNSIVIKMRSANYSQIEVFKEKVKGIAGVQQLDGSSYYPGIVETRYIFQVETENGLKSKLVPTIFCGLDYLDALGIKIESGRGFQAGDNNKEAAGYIINKAAAREFGWDQPLGRTINGPVGANDNTDRTGEVIGVVDDFNFTTLHNKVDPLILFMTNENWGSQFVYLKVNAIHPNNLVSKIESEFKAIWPEFAFEWEYLDSKYASLYKQDYEIKDIFKIGLLISVLVSGFGIFSVSALLVIMRTKEMGIRKIVGANRAQIFLKHMESFFTFFLIALCIGFPIVWYLANQWLDNFAYRIELNFSYYIFPALVALLIVIATSGFHGIKTSLANPVDSLKQE